MDQLRKAKLMSDQSATLVEDKFEGLMLDLVENEGKNQSRKSSGRRYSDEIKKFALTVSFSYFMQA